MADAGQFPMLPGDLSPEELASVAPLSKARRRHEENNLVRGAVAKEWSRAVQQHLALPPEERAREGFPALEDAVTTVKARLGPHISSRVAELVRIEAQRPGAAAVPALGDPHYERCLLQRVLEGADAASCPGPARPHER